MVVRGEGTALSPARLQKQINKQKKTQGQEKYTQESLFPTSETAPHETLGKFDLKVVHVPGKDNTVADCLSRWAILSARG